MTELMEIYHNLTSQSIDEKGIFPHNALLRRGGSIEAIGFAVEAPLAAQSLRSIMKENKPDEVVYGFDRHGGEQGTMLDLVAGAHWNGEVWRPFIIEYQHEPRIVKPTNYGHEAWNMIIAVEVDAISKLKVEARRIEWMTCPKCGEVLPIERDSENMSVMPRCGCGHRPGLKDLFEQASRLLKST